MDHTADLERVVSAVRQADRLLLTCHIDPDPDCIGSMLAFHWLCRQLGKTSIPVSHDAMLPQWDFFPFIGAVKRPDDPVIDGGRWDALVVLDCEIERTGDARRLADAVDTVITVDHHITNAPGSGTHWIHPEAAATGEMVFDIIDYIGLPLDADAATLLYVALMSDTGSFRFANTSAKALSMASRLVAHGASPSSIAEKVYDTRSWTYLRLLGNLLQTMQISDDGQVAWVSLSRAMVAETGAQSDETEGFVQYPRMISGVEVAAFFRELDNGDVRVSLRSKERVNVSGLAAEFGGGGHPRAAGCTLPGPLSAAEERVVARAVALTNE